MNIQQQPDVLSLSGNMKDVVLAGVTDGEVTFRLFTSASATLLMERIYAPDSAGTITIDIHRFIEDRQLFVMSSETTPWQQPDLACTYYFTVGDLISENFTVVRGGVSRLADTVANWLTQNFLTWQPTTKRVTYSTPELLTYYAQEACKLQIKVYYEDNPTELLDAINLTAGAWTIPVSYSIVASLAAGLPGAYDVWIENNAGQRLTYVQRYLADSMREGEQWILFENSLGGVDVFRAYGMGTVEVEHEHHISETDDTLDEYRVDLKRLHRKSTGWMDKFQRLWMLDFFPARRRWIIQGGAMLPIVLTEDTATYTVDNMPAEFEFTFRYASAEPYLNIPRVYVPATVMNITAPDMQSFTIPPRLVEFPRLSPSEGGLIPIQHPYSEEWNTLSLEELLSDIGESSELLVAGKFDKVTKGSKTRPIYFDDKKEAQVIEGLSVPKSIESTEGGVSARGIADLDADASSQPAIEAVPYAELDDTQEEDTGQVPTAFSVAVLKKQLDYASLDEFQESESYIRGALVKRTDSFGVARGYRFKTAKAAGIWDASKVDPLNVKTLSTPLNILQSDMIAILSMT